MDPRQDAPKLYRGGPTEDFRSIVDESLLSRESWAHLSNTLRRIHVRFLDRDLSVPTDWLPLVRDAFDAIAQAFWEARKLTKDILHDKVLALTSDAVACGGWVTMAPLYNHFGATAQHRRRPLKYGSFWFDSSQINRLREACHGRLAHWEIEIDGGHHRATSNRETGQEHGQADVVDAIAVARLAQKRAYKEECAGQAVEVTDDDIAWATAKHRKTTQLKRWQSNASDQTAGFDAMIQRVFREKPHLKGEGFAPSKKKS